MSKIVLLIFCLTFLNYYGNGSKILGLFPAPTKSHFVMFEALMIGLAERGHEVDVVSHFPQKHKIKGYNDISLLGTLPIYANNITLDIVEDWNHISTLFNVIVSDMGHDLCKYFFNTQIAKDLKVTNKKYDVLITEVFGSDCFLGFAHHFKIPSIGMMSPISMPWSYDRMGVSDNPSYVTNYFSTSTDDMNLYDRIVNTAIVIATKIGYQWISVSKSDPFVKNFFGQDFPDINTLIKNTSLILVNSHFSMNFAKPTVPNFIEVGGLHVGVPKDLPKKMQNVIKPDTDGLIFLSMGSMVKTETFRNETLQAMFDTFAELPNYQVFWKANRNEFDKNLKIPNNIYFEKWMPQLDVLCHPKTKLFISHGGLMGGQEGTYCGVPRLGIPMFADQPLNIKSAESMGLAIQLHFKEITKPLFSNALRKLLDKNEGYKSRSEKAAELFKDRPNTPMETSIYWVEYIIRYGGAPHLRTKGADLSWYKYHLLDVGIIFAIIVMFILYISYLFLSILLSMLIDSYKRTRTSSNKKVN